MRAIQQILKSTDIYGTEVQLYINGKNRYTTYLGGLMTLVTVTFTTFFLVYFGMELFQRKEPRVLSYYNDFRNGTVLNNTNFLMAIKATHYNGKPLNLMSDKYFRMKPLLKYVNVLKQNRTDTELPVVRCTDEYLQGFNEQNLSQSSSFQDTIKVIKSEFYCVNMTKGINLFGSSFESQESSNLRYHLEVDINKYLKDTNMTYDQLFYFGIFPIEVQAYYQTYSYNPTENKPLKKEIGFINFLNFLKPIFYINTQFVQVRSVEDNNLLFTEKIPTDTQGLNTFNLLSMFNEFLVQDPIQFMFVNIYIDNRQMIYVRTYIKFQDVAASVVGLYNIAYSVLLFISDQYNVRRIHEQLAFSMFKFRPEKTIQLTNKIGIDNFKLSYDVDNKKPVIGTDSNASDCPRNFSLSKRKSMNRRSLYKQLSMKRKTKFKISTKKLKLESNPLISPHLDIKIKKDEEEKYWLKRLTSNKIFDKSKAVNFSLSDEASLSGDKSSRNLFKPFDKVEKQDISKTIINTYAQENAQIKINDKTKTNLIVIESSLKNNRYNNENADFLKGKRKSIKLMNDRSYLFDENRRLGNEEIELLTNNLEDLIKNKEKLGCLEKLRALLCNNAKFSKEFREKIEFYNKASAKVKEKLDVCYMLNKIEEFDKFKLLFLNPYQNLSMKYAKKPNIFHINVNNVVDYYERFTNANSNNDNLKKIVYYFSDKLRKDNLDGIDKRMIELLDNNLKKRIYYDSLKVNAEDKGDQS